MLGIELRERCHGLSIERWGRKKARFGSLSIAHHEFEHVSSVSRAGTLLTRPATSGFGPSIWNRVHSVVAPVLTYCGDASSYDGVKFKISGNAGTTGSAAFYVQTNVTKWADGSKGTCLAPKANEYSDCVYPSVAITGITAEPKEVTILWTDVTGGKPAAGATTADESLGQGRRGLPTPILERAVTIKQPAAAFQPGWRMASTEQ